MPKRKQAKKFTESDYDFSAIESIAELNACYIYEYARESRAVIKAITAERKQWIKSAGKTRQMEFGPHCKNLVQGYILASLTHTSGFPKTPWQNLSKAEQDKMLKMVGSLPQIFSYASTSGNPPLLFSLNEPGTMTLEAWIKQCRDRLPSIPDSDPIKSGFFAVNLKFDRRVLIEEFRKQLTHFEGKAISETPPIEKDMSPPKQAPGRRGIRDGLNALGAMRLRYYCDTFSAAQKMLQPLKGKSHGMFYERRDSANRACILALCKFQEIFGWFDRAKPIHFTEGWRGGTQK